MSKIPVKLQGVLWSIPLDKIDFEKDINYIVHQVLMFGDFSDLRWLFSVYKKSRVKKVFLHKPQKIYTPQALNYIKNFVLNLKNSNIHSNKYINAIY